MNDLYQPIDYATLLFYDNQSTIRLAKIPVFHVRIKRIEAYYHFVSEKVLQHRVELWYIKKDEQVSDLFMKILIAGKLKSFCLQPSIVKMMEVDVKEGSVEVWNAILIKKIQPMKSSIVSLKVL